MTPDDLLPQVYEELRKLAAAKMASEKPGQTLDATALVHEAYLRLVPLGPGDSPGAKWENRGHFFAVAAEAMRRILVDRARAKAAAKRGGAAQREPLPDVADSDADERLLHLDEALTQLAGEDPLAARVVASHHFAGLNHEQVAESLEISVYQARLNWEYARAWPKSALGNY